ncbi:hypothetical protein N0B44_06625 [Roseibacterium beibuensis]|uniref:hypothetical protein n=1 Tax=[Roseibacterium] beibuensis TaxID=1193142 RepID=UPI00217DA88E|nr:hypothetical protein [Roseibacterium beibuensis]MCS6622577.1 hypothetical protein [Roseibacterium beibuensis]
MSSTFRERRRFDVGRVFELTFGAIGANGLPLLLIALLFVGVPQAALVWAQSLLLGQTGSDSFLGLAFLIWLGGLVVSMICNVLMQGVVTHTVVADLQGRKPSIGESFGVALRSFWVLLGIGIVSGLATALGFILLIVPGILIFLIWMVAGPVAIAERTGVGKALSRSRTLTRDHRWWLLLVAIIYVAVSWVLGILAGMLGMAATGFNPEAAGVNAVTLIVGPAIQALSTLIWGAMVAAVYVELRAVKEGGGKESVAAIFD